MFMTPEVGRIRIFFYLQKHIMDHISLWHRGFMDGPIHMSKVLVVVTVIGWPPTCWPLHKMFFHTVGSLVEVVTMVVFTLVIIFSCTGLFHQVNFRSFYSASLVQNFFLSLLHIRYEKCRSIETIFDEHKRQSVTC